LHPAQLGARHVLHEEREPADDARLPAEMPNAENSLLVLPLPHSGHRGLRLPSEERTSSSNFPVHFAHSYS